MSAFLVKLLEVETAFSLASEEDQQEYINNVKESVMKYRIPKHTPEEAEKADMMSWENEANHDVIKDRYYYKILDENTRKIIFYAYMLTREWKEVY